MSRVLHNQESYSRLLDASGTAIATTNGSLNVGVTSTSVVTGTTRVWDNTSFGEGTFSGTHDASEHAKISIYGSLDTSCILAIEYSDSGVSWYVSNHIVTVSGDGIVDGAFNDIAVPYIRLIKTDAGNVSGTILITGKSI